MNFLSSDISREMAKHLKAGFTLVETMVAISIAGILLSLTLLGVQQAIEASRRSQCANHLRQIATSVGSFEATHQHLPSGGWSKNWAGVPSHGVGPAQPGGWIYQLLPYLDQAELFSIGANPGTGPHDPKLLESPIPTLFCPSRRKGRANDNSRNCGHRVPGLAWRATYRWPAELQSASPVNAVR